MHTATATNGAVQSVGSFENQVKAVLGDPDRVIPLPSGFKWAWKRGIVIDLERGTNGATYVREIGVMKAL